MRAAMLLLLPVESPGRLWLLSSGLILGFFAVVWLAFLALRRALRREQDEQRSPLQSMPNTENPSAFLAASMQGVIQRLREQEKELERLHRAEKERAEHSEKLSEEVTRNMPAGLLLVNAAGIISSANPAAEQVLGTRSLAFRRYSEALGENSELAKLLSSCLKDGTIFRREQVEHVSPKGETRSLGITISPTRSRSDKITGAICLLSDLTELLALQQQVQLKENLAALGELSAGIAHEFKNALATISGYAQMIRAEYPQGETADCAELILEQTRNITQVVSEFLKYARPLEIPDEEVSLQPVVERVVSELREAIPNVKITAEGHFGQVAGEEGFLRQAILNLARNAAEAAGSAPGGGRVRIQGGTARMGNSEVQQVTIVDNGPGIPAEAFGKIFHPFYTTKTKGTGLGLAVVQKIIVQHGGKVEARNRPEGGAEFIVTLPGCRAAAEAIESKRDRI